MIKAGITYSKLTALFAVLAITLIQSLSASTAAALAPRPNAPAEADLSAELRVLDSFADDLNKFDRRRAELSKRASLTREEFDPLQRTADDLKRRLSQVQNALRDAINKLKASGDWDDLDAKLIAKITDSSLQSRFSQNSFKKLLEESSSQLSGQANDISSPLDALRTKISANRQESQASFVTASFEPEPALSKSTSLGCRVQRLRSGLMGFVRGTITTEQGFREDCACSDVPLDPSKCAD